MTREFSIKEFFQKHRNSILLSICLFWFVFAALIIVEDEIALRIANMKADPIDRFQYFIRFILWTLLTPGIILLAVKFPVRKKSLLKDLALHLFFAMLVVALEFCIEIPIVRFWTERMTGKRPPVIDYAAVFILKLNIYFLLYFLIAGVTYLVLAMESYNQSKILAKEAERKNQQLLAQLAEARLRVLKMQLDPHFLFNTHHSIVSLMLNNENEKAIGMLTKLSDLLRLSLEEHEQTIVLEREILLLRLYLDIQQIRFHERLCVKFQIDPAILSYRVPSFILQPLVENAIKHGLSVSAEPGTVSIEAKHSGNDLVLSVTNKGRIMDPENIRYGIGIRNTQERLLRLYESNSLFELRNANDHEVIASITIPMN